MGDPSIPNWHGFTRRPDALGHRVAFDLLRVKPGWGFKGVILSHDSMGEYTHYWGGRTSPCLAVNCRPCEAGNQHRWYCWQAVWDEPTRKIAILEIPYVAATELYNFFDEHRTLRGWPLELKRRNGKANSTLVYKWGAKRVDAENLPKAPEVEATMRAIWKIHSSVVLYSAAPKIHDPNEHRHQA